MTANLSTQAGAAWPPGKWQTVAKWLLLPSAVGVLAGWWAAPERFGSSWLLAFMFFLSIALGAQFLVIVHHLFDASWSAPIRRFCEHIACLCFPWMALLYCPLAFRARDLYAWMNPRPGGQETPSTTGAVIAPFLFHLAAWLCFGVWWAVSHRLRHWSLQQDKTGLPECTWRMRRVAVVGAISLAGTLTLGAVLWMQMLQYPWVSAIYGVYYFAGCAWVGTATAYLVAALLRRTGPLRLVLRPQQFYYLGTLLLAFTVFYAYIHFSQYFVIWNANLPEETWWYARRARGAWGAIGLMLLFGHFLAPFVALLRIDLKLVFAWMVPLCLWTWAMHYLDLAYNILPARHPDGYPWQWLWVDLACLSFMGALLLRAFARDFGKHAPYPLRDPRLNEAQVDWECIGAHATESVRAGKEDGPDA